MNKNISSSVCLSHKILDKRIILSKVGSGRRKKISSEVENFKISSQTVCHHSRAIILHIMSQLMMSDMHLHGLRTENIFKLGNTMINMLWFF